MARSTPLVLAAGGIAAANEVVFAPIAKDERNPDLFGDFNWRIIPATLILAAVLGGFESVAPDFAVGLGGLVLLATLVIPVGNAPSPVENIVTALGY